MKHGWEIKKLGEFIKEYSVRNKNGVDFPVYSVTNSQGFCKDYFSKEVASKEKSTYKIVPRGCFAYNPSRINVGSVDWQNHENNVIVSPLYVVFEVSDKLNNDFLLYYLKSNHTMQLIKNLATGTVRANLRFDILSSFPIPIPPLPIQERIVSELDCINGILEKKREQIKELDALAQSIFYDMFGDPIQNEKGWEVKKFADCYKLRSGNGLSAKDIVIGKFPVYGGNGIVGYHNEFNLDGENIIIGRVGALCGNVRCVKGQLFVTDNAFILSKSVENNNVFLQYLLTIHNLRSYAREAMQPVISNTSLKNIDIILPPLPLQQAFAAKIEAIEKQKELVKRSIAETETLLASRMQHYFEA